MEEQFAPEQAQAMTEVKEMILHSFPGRIVKLVLYGSRARGDYDEESDIDIAIVIKGLTREEKKEIFQRVAEIETINIAPLSTLVLSEEDFNLLKQRERRIALDIESEGIPL